MARKGENIYKRKDGRWEGRYIAGRRTDGRARYVSVYGKSYLEVKKVLEVRMGARQRGLPQCSLTVKELLELWLSLRMTTIKESSYQRYLLLIKKHILPILGGMQVKNLTANTLSGFIRELTTSRRLDGKGGLSPKMTGDVVCVLKSALRFAGRRYAIVDPELLEVKAPTITRKTPETLSDRECEILSRSVMAAPDLNGAAYLLALNTGLRLGKLCGLKWEDISFPEQSLTVRRTTLRIKDGTGTELVTQDPKTESSERIVPLPHHLLRFLAGFRQAAPDCAYIFTGTDKPMEPRTLQYRFKSFLKGLGLRDCHVHTLRHTFATRFIEAGYDAKTLSEILGHKNVKTTLQLYVHPSMQRKREAVEAISTLLPMVS